MLGELYWYVHQDPPPVDAPSTSETLAYLEACHLLFEEGFLSHEGIRSQILKNISKGYEYFSAWLTSLLNEGTYVNFICYFILLFIHLIDPKYPHTSATQKSFLSWQSKHRLS